MKQAHKQSGLSIAKARIAVLKSKWYSEQVDGMAAKCIELLKQAGCSDIEIHTLPGSLEIPLAAKRLIRSSRRKFDAIVCLGVIMKGETYHFEMIVDETIRGLGRVMLDEDIPIIVEILPCTSLDQAKARSANDEFNKGIEAANAAIEIVHWNRQFTSREGRRKPARK